MKQTLIALGVLVVIGLVLLFLFGRGTTFERRDTAGDGLAATSTRTATTTGPGGTVSGAATGSAEVELPPYYYKG